MEANYKRKEEEIKKLQDKLINKKDKYDKEREKVMDQVKKIKKLK